MKKKGALSGTNKKRDAELLRLWNMARQLMYDDKNKSYLVLDVYELMSTLPCNGYHVSDDSAWRYIESRRKGKTPKLKSPYKRKLYERLYDTVMALRIRADYVSASTQALMYRAMTFRAPCIGLSPARIRSEIERLTRHNNDTDADKKE